jgi:hypothetical protein
MLRRYFSATVGKEDISKPMIVNGSLCKITNDNGVRVVNCVNRVLGRVFGPRRVEKAAQ